MKRIFLCILLFLLLSVNVESVDLIGSGIKVVSGPTNLWLEKFGDDGDALSESWSTIQYDSIVDDSGAGGSSLKATEWGPIAGTQFLATATDEFNSNETYFHFWVRVDTPTTWSANDNIRVFTPYNTSVTTLLFDIRFYRNSSGENKILSYRYTGGSEASWSTSTWTSGVWYEFMGHYKNGDFSAGEGLVELWWSGGGGEYIVENDTTGIGQGRSFTGLRCGADVMAITPDDTTMRLDRMSVSINGYTTAEE